MRKNGSQQTMKVPTTMAMVCAAFFSYAGTGVYTLNEGLRIRIELTRIRLCSPA